MYTYSSMFLRVLNTAESVVCILGEALDFGGPVAAAPRSYGHTPAGPGRGKKEGRGKEVTLCLHERLTL